MGAAVKGVVGAGAAALPLPFLPLVLALPAGLLLPLPPVDEAPKLVAPELGAPKLMAPNPVKPELVAPMPVGPELGVPELAAPKSVKPELEAPKLVAPNPVEPELGAPNEKAPGAEAGAKLCSSPEAASAEEAGAAPASHNAPEMK